MRTLEAVNHPITGGERIAWLLRTNRVYGEHERFATGAVFARAFKGIRSNRGVDNAQLTRWERATQPAGYLVLRRYEDLLGLPPYRLVVVADLIHRELLGKPGPSPLTRRPTVAAPERRSRTISLLDRVLGDDLMTGQDWDDLTTNLWDLPDLILYPATLWCSIADRLLAELIIADGVQWLHRSEALSRMLGHPEGELPVVAACAALAADPSNQVVIDPLMALGATGHPDAAGHVLRQIHDPTNSYTRQAAWWTAAEKVGHGHFSPEQRRTLAVAAVRVLVDEADTSAHRVAAADLLRHLGPHHHRGVAASVRRIAARDRLSLHVWRSGRTMDREAVEVFLDRVGAATLSAMPRDALPRDPMLRQLLDEMLYHPQFSRRFVATQTIKATPYRPAVAHALITELGRRQTLGDATTAPTLIAAVGQLADAQTRHFLEQLALSVGVPRAVSAAAVTALAHCAGRSDDAFWKAAMRRHQNSPGQVRGLVYALGIDRNEPMLRRHLGDPSVGGARDAAAWWLNLPRYIADSTRR